MLTLRRGCGGCCSGCLWLFAITLLIYSWEGSSRALRAVELLTSTAVVVVAAAFYQHRHRAAEPRESVTAP